MTAPSSGKGVSPSLEGADLLRTVPKLAHVHAIRVESPYTIPSGHLTLEHLMELSCRVNQIAASNPDAGLVITTGTDTLEEAAYFIDLTYPYPNPLVFTGAMRDASQISPDGPRNIMDAVMTAVCQECRNLGVLVVLNGEIHAARDVTKTHTTDVSTFRSPMLGPLGLVQDEKIVMRRKPWIREYINTKRVADRVELIKCIVGGDGRTIHAMMNLGVDGFVVEAFGGGHVPPAVRDAIAQAVKMDLPVVVTSRCHWGELLTHTYDYEGSEIDLRALGALFIGCLNGPKARIKLSLCLGADLTRDQLKRYFPD